MIEVGSILSTVLPVSGASLKSDRLLMSFCNLDFLEKRLSPVVVISSRYIGET